MLSSPLFFSKSEMSTYERISRQCCGSALASSLAQADALAKQLIEKGIITQQ
jgi:hypothetical protein